MSLPDEAIGVYLTDVLVAEFNLIKRPTYRTDVRNVVEPDYLPDDMSQIIREASGGCSLLLWSEDDDDVEGTMGGPHQSRCALDVVIVGVLAQSSGLQRAIKTLASDVRRVMIGNRLRTYPGDLEGNNEYGLYTESIRRPTFRYGYVFEQGASIAMFESFWRIHYKFYQATG